MDRRTAGKVQPLKVWVHWNSTQVAKDLWDQISASELERKLLLNHYEWIKGERERPSVPWYLCLKLFTTSGTGLGIFNTTLGRRDSSVQKSFRTALIEEQNSKDPDREHEWLWCPIKRCWTYYISARATHLFAYEHGQSVMNMIFGFVSEDELFSPLNGLLVAEDTEERINAGLLVIVPDVADGADTTAIEQWHISEPKEYKVRVTDKEDRRMNHVYHPLPEATWNAIDGRRLMFRSDCRPKPRYLYFLYCVAMLRCSWRDDKSINFPSNEFEKPLLAVPGQYVRRNMLRAFVEEIGSGSDSLMMGAIRKEDVEGDEIDASALAVANRQNQLNLRHRGRGEAKARHEEQLGFDDKDSEDSGSDDD